MGALSRNQNTESFQICATIEIPSRLRQAAKRPDGVYDNIKVGQLVRWALSLHLSSLRSRQVSKSSWDSDLVKANAHFISVNLETGGGGAFAVIPLEQTGKLHDGYPVVAGHGGQVLDTDWNPFNDFVLASGAEDAKAMIWKIPQGGLTEQIDKPVLHSRVRLVEMTLVSSRQADFLRGVRHGKK